MLTYADVCTHTHTAGELEGMASERLDTFRRKFKNFQLGDLGQSSERRLQAMRVCAEKEKSQAEIYLSQNRKWYGQLMRIAP